MGIQELKNILGDYDLRNTSCRYDVLNLFIEANYALAPKDLEHNLQKYDRVTLYRTLNTFIEKGLIHKIPNDSGIAKYALTASIRPHNENDKYEEEHIHFKCDDCGRTECLTTYQIPEINLPKGYRANAVNLIVTGQCNHCRR